MFLLRVMLFIFVTRSFFTPEAVFAVAPPHRPSVSLAHQLAILQVLPGEYKLGGKGKARRVVELKLSSAWRRKDLKQLEAFSGLERLDCSECTNVLQDIHLDYVVRLRDLRWLDLSGDENITNEGCQKIAKLPRLEHLVVSSQYIDDAGVAHIARLPKLRYLKCLMVKDKGLQALSRSPQLEHLEFQYGHFTQRGTGAFARMGRLKRLFMWRTKMPENAQRDLRHLTGLKWLVSEVAFTDSGFEAITSLPELERLHFNPNSTTGPSMKSLATITRIKGLKILVTGGDNRFLNAISQCPSLEWLYFIGDANANNVGVGYLKQCKTLRELDLVGAHFTDACIPQLMSMKNLRRLCLDDITMEALQTLQKALPHLKYEFRAPLNDAP